MTVIYVGSENPTKIEAVKEIIQDYPFLRDAQVHPVAVSSGVSAQPLSLDDTVRGAMNRANTVFTNCNYSIGLEGGLMDVPYSATGKMNVCACAIFDGRDYYIGLSAAFEHPREVLEVVLQKGLTIAEAYRRVGLTEKSDLGQREGAIGILTKGRLIRKDYEKQALRVALIHLERRTIKGL